MDQLNELCDFFLGQAYGPQMVTLMDGPKAAGEPPHSNAGQFMADRVAFMELGGFLQSKSERFSGLDMATILTIITSMVTLFFGGMDSPLATLLTNLAALLLPLIT